MSIPESAPIGSVVGHVETQDPDLGINAEMRYRVIDGDGREVFDISADSTKTYGVITVKQVLSKNYLSTVLITLNRLSSVLRASFYFSVWTLRRHVATL